ncbi:DUF998 domain-containing protein [Paenibacillus beijingensis]|uniref:DUF998 domain-containing protein n=1 Tax=Paenibacillus beijingensis TaxID=1126833 RepID=A0A0D5NEW5_9BACL|nr:DUF998 domain-containing protein [Paenibacillus beijingensis]AJY73522.1 hypothetical protein VN24_01390 [Paenibacillus beijingensis]
MQAVTTKPETQISQTAARLSWASAVLFLVLLAALHVIKPEFDPSWRMVSEYAIGRNGWVMTVAFLSLSVSCAALFVAIRSQIRTAGGYVGLTLLLISAAAIAAAAFFTIDPITASKDSLTTHGNLHGLASMIGNPGLTIAAILISRSLTRAPSWSPARRSILWMSNLIWICLLLMLLTLAVMLPGSGGKFGPDVLIGWPNRLLMAAYGAWLISAASRALKLHRQSA